MTTFLIHVIYFNANLEGSHTGFRESMPSYALFNILGIDFLCFQKRLPEMFPPTPPLQFLQQHLHLRQILVSALLYKYGSSKAGEE